MEQNTIFVSSRGVLKSCCAHNRKPRSSNPAIDEDLLERHVSGGSIYVCTEALNDFSKQLQPRISVPFTLVSGDSDLTVDPAALGAEVCEAILDHPCLQAWYAQNCCMTHPKLCRLPIGLDYHSLSEGNIFWGVTTSSPVAQEFQLLETLARSVELERRQPRAYCSWLASRDRGDRRDCFERIDKSVCFLELPRIPRASSWARQTEFAFVVSPQGNGPDCHRTWEALVLGCIPIVKRSPVCDLFADLPVLIVDDWAEVRRERLDAYLDGLAGRSFDHSGLLRDTWVRRINGFPPNPAVRASCAEFRHLILRRTG
jgi:hypothetical protein